MLDSVKNSAHLLPLLDSMEVQPEKVYGAETQLIASSSVEKGLKGIGQPRPNVVFFDLRFSLSLFLLLFLSGFFIFFRRNLSNFWTLLLDFRKFWNYRRAQSWNNFLFFLFLFLFSVSSLSLFFAEVLHNFFPVLTETMSFGSLFVTTCGAMSGFLLLRFFVNWLIGVVSNEKQLLSDIIYSQLLFFTAMGFAITPLILVKNFCIDAFAGSIFMLLYVLLLLIFAMYFFRTIRLFIQENNSIFFWILYFCTVEILPIIAAIKFLGGI